VKISDWWHQNEGLTDPKFFRILDQLGLYFDTIFGIFYRLGLNFKAINLKFLQTVGNIIVYKLSKFQIDSLQIKIKISFDSP